MTKEQNHYQVLGLVPDAEPAVVRAAYRALVSIYHPDKNRDKSGDERIKAITVAYEVLSDPERRRIYDANLNGNLHNASFSEFESETPFISTSVERAWAVATEFYSHLEENAKNLERISWRLGFAFKLALLLNKKFTDSRKISIKMKREYLSRFFGTDQKMLDYAEKIIISNQKDAALYLNEIISIMGNSVTLYQAQCKVEEKFPNLRGILNARQIYLELLQSKGASRISAAIQLIEHHEGSFNKNIFSSKIIIKLDNNTIDFKSIDELYRYLLEKYAKYA